LHGQFNKDILIDNYKRHIIGRKAEVQSSEFTTSSFLNIKHILLVYIFFLLEIIIFLIKKKCKATLPLNLDVLIQQAIKKITHK
jgi:hypothetical protein